MGDKSTDTGTNRLIKEKSPYLLQHAYNPVDWFPWGEEAFETAKQKDMPVFLSIGYSTCHWCHVMERESFENSDIAGLLNEAFICVKVDREERPDIDDIYMSVCQAITGRGGWPLTILMTPDKKPFYAATYIPGESRHGMPGMKELIPAIKVLWDKKREQLLESARDITAAISAESSQDLNIVMDENVLHMAFRQLENSFDSQYGGFGRAPKFPTPHHLTFLLRYWKRSGNADALEMVERTLDAMSMGGIYDHIGFGFHRYSTDRQWLLPHFEKMLYDQAMMVTAFAEAYQVTGKPLYRTTAEEILSYLKRDMRSPGGAFYSAEDADSQGEEGRFYLWTAEETENILGSTDSALFNGIYNIEAEGNFAGENTDFFTGKNIPHMIKSIDEITASEPQDADDIVITLEKARKKLFLAREKRIHPSKDDKILTDWNGLAIVALCKAAQAFGDREYEQMAENAADFFMEKMTDSSGKMLHRYRDGEAAIDAFLEDYAFFIWGLIELYETGFKEKYLEHALKLHNYVVSHFMDSKRGGFFHTSDEAEKLIFRSKEVYDGAIPSGNSVSAMNIQKLARITGDTKTEELAYKTIQAFADKAGTAPIGYTQFMSAVDLCTRDSVEIVIAGNPDNRQSREIIDFISSRFIPEKTILLKTGNKDSKIPDIAPFTGDMEMKDGLTTVHVCRNRSCGLPSNDADRIKDLIEALVRN